MNSAPSRDDTRLPRGLEGVIVADTQLGGVREHEGYFHYRGYSAVDLAERRSFEDVWYLFATGALPTREQAVRFRQQLAPMRTLGESWSRVFELLTQVRKDLDPMPALRTALSLAAESIGTASWLDRSERELRHDSLHLCALLPSLIAAIHRAQRGQRPLAPRTDLSHAENYLYQLTGKLADARHARALEQYWILTVDHGFNASTFAARVVTSTGADVGSALAAAVGALSGPLHGGAPSRVLEMLEGIGEPRRARGFLEAALARGERLMGFGHRVYRGPDPRSSLLYKVAQSLGGSLFELAREVESEALALLAERHPGRPLATNVEYYAGVVLSQIGLPTELFPTTFAASRAIGWSAHVLEQLDENRLIRPRAAYVGQPPPLPVPAA